jgi:TRAP transporter TAXI family solute receptor
MASSLSINRRRCLGLLAAAGVVARPASGVPIRQFTIATGDLAGTYYPLGGTLASLLSAPPGGEPCRPGELCGVPGLVVVAQTSEGSIANLEALAAAEVDSAFVQADVAHAAFAGRDLFATAPFTELRALASLYREVVQLVVRQEVGRAPRRLAVGAPRSGSRLSAPAVLPAFGVNPRRVEMVGLNPSQALPAMEAGEVDGFLTIAGTPTTAVREASARGDTQLLPILPEPARRMLQQRSHWRLTVVRDGLYPGVPATPSLAVPALWVVRSDLDADLVRALLETLWSPAARQVLDTSHPAARQISLVSALDGVSVPLHEAAAAYYRSAGLMASPNAVPHSGG